MNSEHLKRIHPFNLTGGSSGKLFLVSTLKDYLHRSERDKARALFQANGKEANPFTVTQLGMKQHLTHTASLLFYTSTPVVNLQDLR